MQRHLSGCHIRSGTLSLQPHLQYTACYTIECTIKLSELCTVLYIENCTVHYTVYIAVYTNFKAAGGTGFFSKKKTFGHTHIVLNNMRYTVLSWYIVFVIIPLCVKKQELFQCNILYNEKYSGEVNSVQYNVHEAKR